MIKKTLIFVLTALLMIPAVPQQTEAGVILTVVLGTLRTLGLWVGQWAVGRLLDDVVDREPLQNRIHQADLDIQAERLRVERTYNGAERKRILDAIDSVEDFMNEFRAYAYDRSLTDAELLRYCQETIDTRIATLTNRLRRVEDDVRTLQQKAAQAEWERERLGEDIQSNRDTATAIRTTVDSIVNHKPSWSATLGVYYREFSYLNGDWTERHQSFPMEAVTSTQIHDLSASIGFWYRGLLYAEVGGHYIPEQHRKVRGDRQNYYYDLSVSGYRFSAVGMITFPKIGNLGLGIGGGYTASFYDLGYTALNSESADVSSEYEHEPKTEDFIGVFSLKFDLGGPYLSTRLEAIPDDRNWRKVNGVYFRCGLLLFPWN